MCGDHAPIMTANLKILCFSDLHRNQDAARQLVRMADDVDFVVGAGDFANRHEGLADTLDILAAIDRPAVLVPGNGETVDELAAAAANWKSARVLHGNGCEIDGVSFWGVGGGIPVTPFGDWSYDFDEDQAAEMLGGCGKVDVLVVHSPPLGIVDHDSAGKVRGSASILDCVQRNEPKLVVCGHIHSSWTRRETVGPSTVLNAGPGGITMQIGVES
ncbi:Calcineurin-like phosphoesterase superfamily domain protein [Crateriforma conspicua]|nr:Calcineurin-like phosphoesterase superfamily domain protein [Crateriforma conspicua]